MDDQVLAAFQWAGRATVEPRSEQAFMLYVIALDTLLSGGAGESGASTYRLRLRCAHLLGATVEQRREVAAKVATLYSARSKLVHSGFATLTPAEIGLARSYAKGAIIRFLTHEPFVSFKSRKDLDAWFESKLLGAGGREPPTSESVHEPLESGEPGATKAAPDASRGNRTDAK